MNSATPALLALLLVCSLAAIAVVAAEPEAREAETPSQELTQQYDLAQHTVPAKTDNTTNRLGLNGDVTSEHAEHKSDLGTALRASDSELRVDHEQYVFLDDEFEDATAEEQGELIDAAYDQLMNRIDEMESYEETVVQEHNAGERSSTELLQMVLDNYHEAGAISDALDNLSDRAGQVSGYSLSVQDQQSELAMHQTAVRSELERADGTDQHGTVVLIQTSDSGYVVELIGSEYVREVTRFDNRDTSESNQFADITDAYDYAGELYPWVFQTGRSPTVNEYTTVQLYRVSGVHDQGRFEAHLDGGTGEIHREVQELSAGQLPVTKTERWSDNGLDLTLNMTIANGPVELTVTDSETGEPESGTVMIDEFEVGETGLDGSLWILPPPAEYEISVDSETGTASTTVAG